MNADENKMLIGVYLRSSAAINDFFAASYARGSDPSPERKRAGVFYCTSLTLPLTKMTFISL